MKNYFGFKQQHSIGFKILVGVLFISGLATLFIASYQLYRDYQTDVRGIEERLHQIESSYLKSVINSLWEMNEGQVKISLEGILNLPDVESVVVKDEREIIFSIGKAKSERVIVRKYKLIYDLGTVSDSVGELIVTASLENAIARLKERIIVVFLSQALKTMVTSFFILILIRFLVTSHVEKIAQFFKKHDIGTKPKKLVLDRVYLQGKYQDEFDSLVQSVNEMVIKLDKEFNQRVIAEKELLQLNINLESLVDTRTKQLVEANKLATLGEMAGGVAHEINSPLSVVHGLTRRLVRQVENRESIEKLTGSLVKIENLVDRIFIITKGLGMFARDSSHDKFMEKKIVNIIKTVVGYANARYIKTNVIINFNAEQDNFILNCQESTVSQILNTLISHSVHKVKDLEENWILLSSQNDEGVYEIIINDGYDGDHFDVKDFLENPFNVKKGVQKGSGLELSLLCGMLDSQNIKIIFGDGSQGYKYRLIFKDND